MVRINKPAHWGDPAITDKTGGCNNEASVGERMCIDRLALPGTWVHEK